MSVVAEEGSPGDGGTGHLRDQTAPRRTFRRPRAGRACGTCHQRRVRCDAGSRGLPCTNCSAFSLECSIPPKKKKRRDGDTAGGLKRRTLRARARPEDVKEDDDFGDSFLSNATDFASLILEADRHMKQQPEHADTYAKLVKPEEIKQEIENPGRVAYLEEYSNLSMLLHDYGGPSGVHYPLPKVSEDTRAPTRIHELEKEILRLRGALSLPPRELCDKLIQAYFKWVAPIVPIINQSSFMQRYGDPENPPSMLLMQTMLLAGSKVCSTSTLLDADGSPITASTLFYKRAKALFDADYENDRVVIVQALILMGWYWEDRAKVTKNVFYWNGLAVTIAHGCGMHRSTKRSRLTLADQRLWTRIWWTLFTRDRSVAVALGRPAHIDMDNSDVQMICEDDFVENDFIYPSSIHVNFFLQYVKLCEIMDLVLLRNYSISPKAQRHDALALTHCDLALADWLQYCPVELQWDESRYSFWSAYLQCVYHTTSCLLHRAYLPPAPKPPVITSVSRSPAFQAANTITSIIQALMDHDELRYAPPFLVYSLLSALIVHTYQVHIAIPVEKMILQERISICMEALEKVAKIWLVGKMVHDLFQTVLAYEAFDDPLQKASRYDRKRNLDGRNPDPEENTKVKSSLSADDLGNVAASSGLTPGLVDYMAAALDSAKSPPSSSSSADSSRSRSSTSEVLELPRLSPQELGMRYLVVPDRDQWVEHSLTWMDYEQPKTPGPTGFDSAELYQFFGVRSNQS